MKLCLMPFAHARNLFHVSMAMYDAWAAYDNSADTYLIDKTTISPPADIMAARKEAISYVAFRVLMHRFANSPGKDTSLAKFRLLMSQLGYDESITTEDYTTGSPAALGNFIAAKVIEYGLKDNSNEINNYANQFYQPVNPPLSPSSGIIVMNDCNRWQQLLLTMTCNQNCSICSSSPSSFLSAEWGRVTPFALKAEDRKIVSKDGYDYWVYHDPGPPPMLDSENGAGLSKEFMWNFSLVSVWSSHLDQRDGVMIDISPASKGNIQESDYPTTIEGLRNFYHLENGGDIGMGYSKNPKTDQPYIPQVVPRGDYARVLAEFWADGPTSETPPGHWFTILNYVSDHPKLEKKFGGKGNILDALEWDIKAYFIMGGAVHDAAITAWGIKGYYDYVRPISAIRFMAQKGQSSNSSLPLYHPAGIPLLPGFIELVSPGDPLAGANNENVNKIKLRSWLGPNYVPDPDNFNCSLVPNPIAGQAGVGWVLAENWVPYQRPTFVTPPFAGYISGHSTYSSAGAEVLTQLTGDEYFPGGLAEFPAKKDNFLVFETGPSVDITLQWAKYKDASDQCSLSRIWGGIHPPADDMPGRLIGKKVGEDAFALAVQYFNKVTGTVKPVDEFISVYPNPVSSKRFTLDFGNQQSDFQFKLVDLLGREIQKGEGNTQEFTKVEVELAAVSPGVYFVIVKTNKNKLVKKLIVR